ncbi:hypothetical protein GOODEAATRI_006734 [Goodea atripinnis]|uniref:LRRCT domain-containing protein n=1 Tax=Goodea atripinnis TaxID=208336 RepID=A0ABV0MZA1_9TELE
MNSVVELQLEENPWNCSCELIALKTWLESISYTALVGDVVCEFPFRLHGRDLDEVSKQELCPRRAIAEYEMPPSPHLGADAYYRTTPALGAFFTASGIARSSSRPTKGPRQSAKLKSKPTARVLSNKPQNYGQIVSYQTKSPVPLDCPTACTCNLQISDLGLNVNCQERKIEQISDLNPKPYNPKKMYLTGNYIPVVRRLFVATKKKRQKSQSEQNESMNACISSLNMEYGLYKKGSIPKVRTSAGHVYEYIPPPTEATCRTAAQTPMDNKSVDGFRDFDELSSAFLGNLDEEAASNVISSEYGATTPEPLNKPFAPCRDDPCYYRDVLEPDKNRRHSNSLLCRHGAHSSNQYTSDFDASHQYVHPESIQQTILYCTAPSSVYVEPNRSEYWELKAKLHLDPDYLEVLEKRTTFTQF